MSYLMTFVFVYRQGYMYLHHVLVKYFSKRYSDHADLFFIYNLYFKIGLERNFPIILGILYNFIECSRSFDVMWMYMCGMGTYSNTSTFSFKPVHYYTVNYYTVANTYLALFNFSAKKCWWTFPVYVLKWQN